MDPQNSTPRLFGLAFALLMACGDPVAPRPPTTVPTTVPATPEVAPPPVPSPRPEVPAPPTALAGDVCWIDDDTRAVFLPIDPLPQPDGAVIGQIELHHSHRVLRLIDEVPAPPTAVIVDIEAQLCEARVIRARRLHTLFIGHDGPGADGYESPTDPRTYLALDIEGCERGTVGISGVPLAEVRVRSLRPEALREHATPALVEAVRHVDDGMWGGEPHRGDSFRMLDLPAHGITIVVGTGAWVLRDGVVLSGAEPVTLIEAGPLVLFELQTPSEGWLGSLADFAPSYVPGECEVTDASGTSMNVRAGPRGNATVVTTLAAGTRVTANDMSGSWFHLASSPPGWAHQRGLRCEPLQPVSGH